MDAGTLSFPRLLQRVVRRRHQATHCSLLQRHSVDERPGYAHQLADIGKAQLRIVDRDSNNSAGSREIGQACVDAVQLSIQLRRSCLLAGRVSTRPVTDLQRNACSNDIQVLPLPSRIACRSRGIGKRNLAGKPESHLIPAPLEVGDRAFGLKGAFCVCDGRHRKNYGKCDRATPNPQGGVSHWRRLTVS